MNFILELTYTANQGGYGEYIYELALYESKNECAMTDNVFFPISEVCDGTVSLETMFLEPPPASLGLLSI